MSARKAASSWRDRPRKARLPEAHVFHRNGIPTRRGGPEGCADCPLPAGHPVHIDPPDNPIADLEDRKLGESTTTKEIN